MSTSFNTVSSEMVKTNSISPTDICAANIAVLLLLHRVPSPPLKNSIEDIPDHGHDCILPFEEERRLTNTLAFLSSIKDDPDHIPAVAILEGRRPLHLSVLVAVNRRTYSDGNRDLQQIKAGFEGVFVALAHTPGTSTQEERVFEAIIAMCSERIQCRLRLVKNSNKKPRQPMIAVLNEAILSLQRLRSENLQHLQGVVDVTVVRMRSVIQLVDAWTKYQKPDSLRRLVAGIHDLWRVGQLQTILEAIPNREMAPNSRKSLLNIMRKVARYREAAKMLCRIAKKYPQVHDMTVVPVELPKKAFERSASKKQPILEAVLHKFDASRKQPNLGNIYRILKVDKDQANILFSEQVSKTLSKSKIHAEIQIIFYCELNRTVIPPRIVRSSKTACFLCNTFISMYKKIQTPRCHGRLYPGWRLPQLSAFVGLQMALNGVLENFISQSLRTMLATEKKIMYPDPNESSLCSLPMTAATSVLGSLHSNEQIESKHVESEEVESEGIESERVESQAVPPSDPLLTECCESNTPPNISDDMPGNIEGMVKREPEHTASDRDVVNSSRSDLSALSEKSDVVLMEGLEVLQSINHYGSSRLYRAGPLEVYLECPSAPSQLPGSGTNLSDIPVKIKWLLPEELEASHTDNDSKVIDADLLGSGTEVGIKGHDIIHIGARGSVLRIEFCQRPQSAPR